MQQKITQKRGLVWKLVAIAGNQLLYLGSAAIKENQSTTLLNRPPQEVQKNNNLVKNSFDPDLWDETGKNINTLPFFLNTIDKAGLKDIVIPIVSTSVEASMVWTKPLAMVFIDGGHSEKAANDDYDVWYPHLVQGGLLAIHDVFPNPEDGGRPPFNIYIKAKESGLFKELEIINSLALLEKLNPG